MYEERPSAKRMVASLAGWTVGLVALFGLIFAVSYAIAPKTPPDTAPLIAQTPSATVAAAGLVPTASAAASLPVQPTSLPTVTPTAPSTTPTLPTPGSGPLSDKVVVIDAGHQAKPDLTLEPIGPGETTKRAKVEAGTRGYKTGRPESAVNLAVALKLRDVLQARGIRVIMVRTTQNVNIANSKRAKIANGVRADLFVRLHCDGSTDHSVAGISTLVPSAAHVADDAIVIPSRNAGLTIQRALVSTTWAKDRGVINRGVHARDDLTGFGWATVPSVLVEMGFLTNAKEEKNLLSGTYQQALANGLASGIAQFLAQ